MANRGVYRRWPYEQLAVKYLPKIDVSEAALADPFLDYPRQQVANELAIRARARPASPATWAQYRPKIDVSEPPLDLAAIPPVPKPRGQTRPSRVQWQQLRPKADTTAAPPFDPPDLPRTSYAVWRRDRCQEPYLQLRPDVAPDRGIRSLHHVQAWDNTDSSTTYVTPTISSIGPMALLFVYIEGNATSPPPKPVPTGCGLTWTEEDTNVSAVRRLSVYSGQGDASFPGAITFTLTDQGGGTACVGAGYAVIGLQGSEPSDIVVQTQGGNAVTANSLFINMGAIPADPLDRPFSAFVHKANEDTTPQTNWTELADTGGTGPVTDVETQWRQDVFDNAAAASWATSSQVSGFVVEVRVAGGFPTLDVPYIKHGRKYPHRHPVRQPLYQRRPKIDVSTTPPATGVESAWPVFELVIRADAEWEDVIAAWPTLDSIIAGDPGLTLSIGATTDLSLSIAGEVEYV